MDISPVNSFIVLPGHIHRWLSCAEFFFYHFTNFAVIFSKITEICNLLIHWAQLTEHIFQYLSPTVWSNILPPGCIHYAKYRYIFSNTQFINPWPKTFLSRTVIVLLDLLLLGSSLHLNERHNTKYFPSVSRLRKDMTRFIEVLFLTQ